jgi:PIN domain nuclease of toxin-antitoxin system
MNLLLDTHAFIWAGAGDRRLSRRAAAALADLDNTIFLSVVSRWEIVAKQRRHAAFRLVEPFESTIAKYDLEPLDLLFNVPASVERMPDLHGDPFDRMLIAQAMHHQLVLVSNDAIIRRYPVETIW